MLTGVIHPMAGTEDTDCSNGRPEGPGACEGTSRVDHLLLPGLGGPLPGWGGRTRCALPVFRPGFSRRLGFISSGATHFGGGRDFVGPLEVAEG